MICSFQSKRGNCDVQMKQRKQIDDSSYMRDYGSVKSIESSDKEE